MKRQYCDRCGQEIDEKRIIPSWVKYYDDREDKPGSYSRDWEYGTFKQSVCGPCLDEMKPTFHSKVATEPAGIQRINVAPQPVAVLPPCSDCWWCRLKRRFK